MTAAAEAAPEKKAKARTPALQPSFASGNVTGAPGESGTMFLLDDAVYVNPLNNDIAGKTDKFLTHSTRLGVVHRGNNEGFDARAGWRFITPSYEIQDGVEVRPPVGKYGDWAELQLAYGLLIGDPAKGPAPRLQLEAGLGHLGPKGAREVQVGLHKELGNAWEHLTWADQKRGVTTSGGLEAGMATAAFGPRAFRFEGYGGLGTTMSPVMFQSVARGALVGRHSRSLAAALEMRVYRQFGSLIFTDLLTYRVELALGLLLTRWYKPTISVVGPYHKGDDKMQVFFDVINLNWPL